MPDTGIKEHGIWVSRTGHTTGDVTACIDEYDSERLWLYLGDEVSVMLSLEMADILLEQIKLARG